MSEYMLMDYICSFIFKQSFQGKIAYLVRLWSGAENVGLYRDCISGFINNFLGCFFFFTNRDK